ncbi:metalloprotease [Bradyrhizobium diazoefficiens]|uniref:ATP-dependent zinc metalloprotease FtsH n=4 Tax=Pseudomonadota TaxID=1224 RepID=A0A0E4BRM6_9BRAD|nr:metalloprotease [Bradyrhizobium diazoefficiens]
MNANLRNFALWVIIVLLLLALFTLFQNPGQRASSQDIAFSQLLSEVDRGNVRDVVIQGPDIHGTFTNGSSFQTYAPNDPTLVKRLYDSKVQITAKPPGDNVPWFVSLLVSWLPFIALIGVWIFLSRQMQGGAGKAMGFGKSRAKMLTEAHGRVTFEDVAGVDEAKQDLQEIVEFLRDPGKFQRLGGRIPRGVLLVGPPGTGKTLIARAVAGEANVPFFTISGSDFVEMFVGVGASRVRDMFEQAKKNAPCIIFIDEIDAVGRHRGAGLGGGNDEREQTLNQLLVEMDGFEANEGVILIAATNRPDVLDPALLRPGRFDRQVVVPNPDVVGREQILKVHVRKVPLAPDINLKTIARGTPGFSGADLMNLVNEAALTAARRNKRMVTQAEFEEAKDKVMMGAERKSLVMTEEEKLLTAYHEGGHAIVGLNVPATDPIHKATIIPRGRALGMVMQLPERDKLSMSLEQMTSRLAIMMGGRVAEELIFGREKVTSGAASDIEQATRLARMMVTRWGLSEELGTVSYGENQDEVFLGMSVSRTQNASEATVQKIDSEIRRLVEEGYKEATRILTEKHGDLEALAKGLLEFETLSGDEIVDLLKGKKPNRESVLEPTTPRASAVPRPASRARGPIRIRAWSRNRRHNASRVVAGCSGKPLVQKLGIKPGFCIFVDGLSSAYRDVVGELPDDVKIAKTAKAPLDMVHVFATEAKGFAVKLRSYRKAIAPDGMIWASWPKKASGVATDVTETLVREAALANGLVDIKVCAVDDVWSGLKLVIPVKDRPAKK